MERLAQYAAVGLAEAGRLRTEALSLARRSTVQTFRAGRALVIAHKKLKADRQWGRWCKAHCLSRVTAWEAMELFNRAGTEEAIADMTLTQAKHKFGITKPPKRRPAAIPSDLAPARNGESTTPQGTSQVLSFPGPQDNGQKQSTEDGYDHGQWDQQPGDSAAEAEVATSSEDTLAVLVKIVDRLEYLAEDMDRMDWKLSLQGSTSFFLVLRR